MATTLDWSDLAPEYTGTIYALIEPDTKVVRYIGQTLLPPTERLEQHIKEATEMLVNTHLHRNKWIHRCCCFGVPPEISILEQIKLSDSRQPLNELEQSYIKQYAPGGRLTNGNGGGGCYLPGEQPKKNDDSKKKRV